MAHDTMTCDCCMWHCYDRCSGERFEVHGSDEDTIRQGVEAYIREGIDSDTGSVDYDVLATAVDGSEYSLSGTVQPVVPGRFAPCQTGPVLPLGTDIDALLRVLEEEQLADQK